MPDWRLRRHVEGVFGADVPYRRSVRKVGYYRMPGIFRWTFSAVFMAFAYSQ